MKSNRCPNCYRSVPEEVNYCPACGQRQNLPELSLYHILADFFGSLFNVEKGLLLTVRMLIKCPGKMFDRFFAGQRIRYMPPVRFFIVTLLLSLIIGFAFNPSMNLLKGGGEWTELSDQMKDIKLKGDSEEIAALARWGKEYAGTVVSLVQQYGIYLQVVNVCLLAFILYVLVRRKRMYNFTEMLCVCLYLFGLSHILWSVLDGLVKYDFWGRLTYLALVSWAFKDVWWKALRRWFIQRRVGVFLALAFMLMIFFSFEEEGLVLYMSYLFWVYYLKRVFTLSFLKSNLYVMAFFFLYCLMLLIMAGFAISGILLFR